MRWVGASEDAARAATEEKLEQSRKARSALQEN